VINKIKEFLTKPALVNLLVGAIIGAGIVIIIGIII